MNIPSLRRLGRHTSSTSARGGRAQHRTIATRHEAPPGAKAPTGCFKPTWTL